MAEITHLRLKLIFYVHFILIVWATIGWWCPTSYLFYNILLGVTLLWGVHAGESGEPIQVAIVINASAVIFDVIILALRYPDSSRPGEHFSAAMAILNLILRPFTTILLYRILQERHGSLGPLESVTTMFGNGQQTNYEDIDRRQQSVVPPTQEHHDFFQPQQL